MSINPEADCPIALVRSEYLFPYIQLLREVGTPIDRELRRARLPILIEELPDSYIGTDLAFRFIEKCAHAEGIDNIGFEAGWRLSYNDFGSVLKDALQQAPTLKTAIETFSRLILVEDSEFQCYLQGNGETMRVCTRQYVPDGSDSRIAEWQNLKAIIELVRKYQHPDWLPRVIGFESPRPVSKEVRHRLGNCRVLTAQPSAFIEIPASILTQTRLPESRRRRRCFAEALQGEASLDSLPYGEDLTGRLHTALVPYLTSGQLSIDLAAEIAGISVRKLQRHLHRMQTSYSCLLEKLRFEQSLQLLQYSDLTILEIALLLGYSDASNFSRAIRRMSGLSPRELRRPGNRGTH